jgi:hypothetical protein
MRTLCQSRLLCPRCGALSVGGYLPHRSGEATTSTSHLFRCGRARLRRRVVRDRCSRYRPPPVWDDRASPLGGQGLRPVGTHRHDHIAVAVRSSVRLSLEGKPHHPTDFGLAGLGGQGSIPAGPGTTTNAVAHLHCCSIAPLCGDWHSDDLAGRNSLGRPAKSALVSWPNPRVGRLCCMPGAFYPGNEAGNRGRGDRQNSISISTGKQSGGRNFDAVRVLAGLRNSRWVVTGLFIKPVSGRFVHATTSLASRRSATSVRPRRPAQVPKCPAARVHAARQPSAR